MRSNMASSAATGLSAPWLLTMKLEAWSAMSCLSSCSFNPK